MSLATSIFVIVLLHEPLISNVQEVKLKATILNSKHITKTKQSQHPNFQARMSVFNAEAK